MKIICFMYGRRVDLYMVEIYKQTHLNIMSLRCHSSPSSPHCPRASGSAHGYGHIDPQVPVVSEQLGDAGVEHEAVRVEDGGGHALVY